jgi:hypothetical protein
LTRRSLHAAFALILIVSLVSISAQNPATRAQDIDIPPEFAADPIPDIWADADSEAARQAADRSWIWGPAIRSATHEPYADSPDGVRAVFYFDKARMEINDPDEDQDSIWYATSGLLIREMMLGQIQVGDSASIETEPADIPVTGDLSDNPASPTYATLGQFTVLGGQEHNRSSNQVGQSVLTRLASDGTTSTVTSPPANVVFAYYDETLGFNVPDVFWDWMNDQPFDWRYMIGHPVTGAFWVDTVIGGEPAEVMVQAFERRILTYNPQNEPKWQVEAGNAGLHYRSWRELSLPDNPRLHALAYSIPYGEIIVDAAVKTGVDPFVLAGVVSAASGFDPKAQVNGDRAGLVALPIPMAKDRGVEYPLDPAVNARMGANMLAMIQNQTGSWESAIDEYFSWQDAVGSFAAPPSHLVEDAIADWQEISARYEGQPSPFGIEPDDDDDVPSLPPSSTPPDADDDPDLYWVGAGRAAHYGQDTFPVERMEHIMQLHVSWGNAIDDWEFDPNGYYCVHPNYIIGERLHLTAPNGETFWCTIADSVAQKDLTYWRSTWAIEVNWDLFEAMGIPYEQRIEVRAPRN